MSLSTAMRRLSLLLLFIFMLLHQANFALSATNAPTPRAAPKACKRGGDLNTVIGLPHVNRAIKALPANFGDMKPIVVVGTDCALNATPDSVCINPVLDDFMTQIQTGSHTSDVTLWPNYIDALAVWAAIGFVFAFFTLIGGFIFCCCRCCCKKCGGGRAIVNQDGQSLAPFWHIAGTYGLLVLFLIFMVAFALAGVVQGNQGLTRAQKAFVKSPNGVITLVKGLFVPVDNLVVGVVGQAAVGLLVRFFNFMDGVIDFDDLHHIIQVCLKAVIDTVTDQTMFGKILIAIDQFKASIDTIPDSDIVGDIIAGFSNTTKVVKPLIDDLQLTLNDIQDGVANITVTTLQDNVDTLNVTFAELRPQFLDVKNMTLDYLSLQDQVELTHAALEKTLVEPYSSAIFDAAQQSVADLLAASIAIPDEVDLANKLIDLNNTINQAVVDLNALINSLNETQNTLDAIPQVSIVNDTLNEIIEVLQNITFDGVDIAINSIGNLFDALPDPGLIFDAIDTITGVTVYIPCVLSINKILDRVNEKVFELPSGINFTSTIDEFNKTFDSTLDQIRDMRNYVKDLNNTFEDGKPNTTAFNDVSDRIRDSIDKAINHIRTLQDQLVEIDTSRKDGGQFNLAPLIEKAIAARDNIENSDAKVSVETVNKVLAMNGTRQNLIVKTQALHDFYTNTFPGLKTTIESDITTDFKCTTDTNELCYDPDNSDAQTPTPLFAAHTSCATLGKGTCQYPYEPTEETLIALESFNSSLSDIPLKSGVVTGIDSAVEKIDAVDFANYNSFDDLQQLQTDLVDYLQNAGDTQKNLDEIFDLDLDDLKDNFDGVDDVLNDVKGNLDDYRQTVVDFNKTLLDQTKIFDNVFDYEGKLYDIVKTLPTRLNTISKDALNNTIRNGDGLYGAADKVIDVFSDMIDKFPVTNPLSSISSQLSIVRILDIAADRKGKLQEAGAINYILSVYGAATKAGIAGRRALNIIEKSASVFGSSAEIQAVDTLLSITRALQEKGNDGSQNGGSTGGQNGGSNGGQSSGLNVDLSNLLTADDIKAGKYKLPTFNGDYVNGEIVAYPSNALCLIDECLDNTIDVYNTRPIPNAQQIFGRSIPVSREQAMLLPFLAPFFVILIGFLVLCLPGCGCCLSCCSICNAFFYFLFVGALFFPMVIFTGDFCGHVESIGATNINQVEPMLCTKLPASDPNVSPYNPAGYCQAGIKTDFFSWDVELDAGEFFRSVTEGCTGLSIANSGDGKAQEPVAALWKSLKDKVAEIVDNQLNTLAQEQISKLGFPLKQPAIDVVLDTSDDLVSIVSTLADDLGTALSCGRISDAYLGFKDTICCDLIGSFYWWAASFYLMAFTLLCCGCPAGALANQKLRGHKCHHVAKKTARETTVIAKAKIQQGKVKAQHLRERVRNGSWAPVTAVPVAVADAEYGVGHAVAYEPHQQGQEMTSFVGKQDNPYDGKVHQE